jgi:hypothetical protein
MQTIPLPSSLISSSVCPGRQLQCAAEAAPETPAVPAFGAQATQASIGAALHRPGGHSVHAAAPLCHPALTPGTGPVTAPGGQSTQLPLPGASLNRPATQAVHPPKLVPTAGDWPAAQPQSAAVVLPPPGVVSPAAQASQATWQQPHPATGHSNHTPRNAIVDLTLASAGL